MKKGYVFISLLLILFLALGAVCASETISDDSLSNDNVQNLESVDDHMETTQNNDLSVETTDKNSASEETISQAENNAYTLETISQDGNNAYSLETISETVNNPLRVEDENSFTQLSLDLNDSTDVFEINHDYSFNSEIDDENGIIINKTNFIINGNNHIIDAANAAAIFNISSASHVTINNLTLKNARGIEGSAICINPLASVTTNNVTFINNTAYSGVVEASFGTYYSNDDIFLDCLSISESVIFGYFSNMTIDRAFMMSSKELAWGLIRSSFGESDIKTALKVYNSIFANTTSKYCTAIKGVLDTEIENCTFSNLHANFTAGAIALKDIEHAIIKNCNFTNISSEKNGGAIFIDAYVQDGKPEVAVEISDSNFVDCYSLFGGAILQLEGILNIDNSNFTSNQALFDGGAIYTSWTKLNINNAKFEDNAVLYDDERGSFGGAIYSDAATINLHDSKFIGNSAKSGGALYLYDSDYDIENNFFENNRNLNEEYDDIYTAFDGKTHILFNNTQSSMDSTSINNEFYETIAANPGMQITILNNSINTTAIPSKFDLRDWGWVTPVEDQGRSGVCWAFSTTGAMEAAILRFLGIEMDISENNVADVSLRYSRFGGALLHEGGSFEIGENYALSWFGVFSSEFDSYDELGKISPIIAVDSSIHFQDVMVIRPCENASDIDHIKQALMQYGAIAVTYFAAQEAPYYNEATAAQYCDNENVHNDHGVTLIGWDDSFSKDNFLITPPGDGAWIFKNSWGTVAGKDGYFYISYYDSTFLRSDSYVLIFDNDIIYNKNYQYDIQGKLFNYNQSNEYRNNFVAIEDDLIAAVGTHFNDIGVEYELEIYVNDELRLVQNGISPFKGYHTIKLDSYIPIKEGDEFTVKVKSNSVPGLAYSRAHFVPGSSEFLYNGNWTDGASVGMVCCLKAYTLPDDTKIIDNYNMTVDYNSGSYFSVKVVCDDGHAVGAGEEVNFTINGKTTSVKTDNDGYAKLLIREAPGNYTISTAYNGKTYENTVIVKEIPNPSPANITKNESLTTKTFSVKNTDKKLVLKATLMIDGKAVEGETIKFTFRGKTYSAKTNKNGVATVTIKNKVFKNLKEKAYVLKISHGNKTIKTSVKIKQYLYAYKASVKKSAKKFKLKAILKINGKLAKGKTIKFTFKGKTYKAKTNKKGIAKVTIKKKVIKKLKKGKTYSVKVSYGKDSVKTTVKIKK